MNKMIVSRVAIVGKLGSTLDGEGFISRLWEDANGHFHEVANLALRDENGNLCGIWGAMSDLSGSYDPWTQDFSCGLYLAGVQCDPQAQVPDGWTKWCLPDMECVCIPAGEGAFTKGLHLLEEEGLSLVAAVQECTNPKTGDTSLLFPIKKM